MVHLLDNHDVMKQRDHAYRWCLVFAAAVCAGCAGSASPPMPAGRPVSGQTAQLVQSIADDVARFRGWEFAEPVPMRILHRDRMQAVIEHEIAIDYPASRLQHVEAGLRMVGLMPPDSDLKQTVVDVYGEAIGGFYDPQTKTFYVIADEDELENTFINRIIIAHELCHALDDQQFDLEAMWEGRDPTEEAEAVYASVAEGSAMAVTVQFAIKDGVRAVQGGEDLMAELGDEALAEADAESLLAAPPYIQTMLAHYMCGTWLVMRGQSWMMRLTFGAAYVPHDVRRLMTDPPRSTEQVLHQEKYWQSHERDEPVRIDDDVVGGLLAGAPWQPVHVDTYGELQCAVLTDDSRPQSVEELTLKILPQQWTTAAATGWGGDRFYLLSRRGNVNGANSFMGLWITAWDTPEDREEFVAAMEWNCPDPNRTLTRLGDRAAVWFYGFDDAARQALEQKLAQTQNLFTCDGQPWSPVIDHANDN